MDNLDFLDGAPPVESAAAQPSEPATPAPEAPAAEAQGQPRGPDGKFVPKAEASPAEAAPQAPAPMPEAGQQPVAAEPAKPPEGFVPVAALQAIREELNQFKRQQQQQPALPPPDPYEDFEGYEAHRQAQISQERADWSRQLAEARHGAELVQQAQQWAFERFDADPVFAQAASSSRDPYGFAIAEYQRHQALSMLSDPANLAKFQAFLSGEAPAPAAAAPAAPPHSPTPPRSLAAAPSAGGIKPGEQPVGPGVSFGSLFG